MITVELRKFVYQISYAAIRSLYGIQEKNLKVIGYHNVEYDLNALVSGWFLLMAQSRNVYRVRIENYNEIVALEKGKVTITFGEF